jgi:hypothetical protein
MRKIFEKKSIEYIEVKQAWKDIFKAWDEYDKLLINFLFENYPDHLQENLEKERFEYLQKIIQENIVKIIRCLGFNPKEQIQISSFQKIVVFLKNKKNLNVILSKENLIKLTGKIQNTISDFNGLDKETKDKLFPLRVKLSIALENFRFYILAYNKVNFRKEIAGLTEVLKLWNKTMIFCDSLYFRR